MTAFQWLSSQPDVVEVVRLNNRLRYCVRVSLITGSIFEVHADTPQLLYTIVRFALRAERREFGYDVI